MTPRVYEDTDVWIADLVREQTIERKPPIIDGFSFVHCFIYGPAILVPMEDGDPPIRHFPGGYFGAGRSIDSLLWPLPRGGSCIGAIGVKDCTFMDCTFHGIGLGAHPSELRHLRAYLKAGAK